MKQILTFSLVLLTILAEAQSPYDQQIRISKTKVGKTVTDAEGISAVEINFPTFVFAAHYDSIRSEVQTVIRERSSKYYKNKGALIVTDLGSGTIKWTKEIVDKQFDFQTTKDYFISLRPEETTVYDRTNGAQKWKKQRGLIFGITMHNLLLAEDGTAFDVHTGQEKWKMRIDGKYGWLQFADLNDSILLIGDVGLKGVNTRTGKYWYHQTVADARDWAMSSASSNIFVDSGLIYFSSKDALFCLTPAGAGIWKANLPKRQTSNAFVWRIENNIVLLNKAAAYIAGSIYDAGAPYLAAFNKYTGKQLYLSMPGSRKTVVSNLLSTDTLLLHTQDKLYSYNIANGKKIAETDVSDSMNKHEKFLLRQQHFLKGKDGQYKSLGELYPNEHFVAGEHNTVRLNNQLKNTGSFTEDVWVLHDTYGNMEILKHDNEYAFIKNGRTLGEYSATKATIYNNWLIDIRETSLRIIDLRTLLN